MTPDEQTRRTRWRLVLGGEAESALGGLSDDLVGQDEALGWLYDREQDGGGRNTRGGLGGSNLTTPEWINEVHRLFPRRTVERLEKDALERYELAELVTDLDLVKRVAPSMTMLKAVLQTKHLMNADVLAEARRIVRAVVAELLESLARPVVQPFVGVKDPRRRSPVPLASNFDARRTVRRNLKNWDPVRRQLVVSDPVFLTRVKRHVDRWQIIICVDQSGSMVDSVIHAAVTAAIFMGVTHLRTHLVAFDTAVVDLTGVGKDPVETLMGVQLGGGTDIGQAMAYCAQLVDTPRRTIVVLISDFYEGGDPARLLGVTKSLVESGVTVLGLAALDQSAMPTYDRVLAEQLVALGAHVAAMTPHDLAAWVAEKVL